jgi:Transposase IS66 family
MWLFIGGPPEQRSFIYHYHATRATKVAIDFFEDFKGYLHADCYNAYITLGKQDHITHVAFRVEGDVTAPNPHRPGRAQLTHPVLHTIRFAYSQRGIDGKLAA